MDPWERFLEEIQDATDDALSIAPSAFQDSVLRKLKAIESTVKARGSFTARQQESVRNMRDGIRRWM